MSLLMAIVGMTLEFYVYVSDDYGKSWQSISGNIPMSPVNVIKEDPKNENVLYLGTDNGAYVTFNRGKSWELFSNGLPNVAFHDIVIQKKANDLVLGTHGRSIYITNIDALQQNATTNTKALTLFDIDPVSHSRRWGSAWNKWTDAFEPSVSVSFYSNAKATQGINVLSEDGTLLNSVSVEADKGFNYATYDLTINEAGKQALTKANSKLKINKAGNGKYYLPKGKYTIKVGNETTALVIE